MRDDMLAQQDMETWEASSEASSEPQSEAGSEREVRIGTIVFDEKSDALGNGRFGFVFRCVDTETGERLTVKQIPMLRFEVEGGKKETSAVRGAAACPGDGRRRPPQRNPVPHAAGKQSLGVHRDGAV